MMMMAFSAYGEVNTDQLPDLEIELESEPQWFNIADEIDKQESQFQVVINSMRNKDSEPEMDSKDDPLSVTLVKIR